MGSNEQLILRQPETTEIDRFMPVMSLAQARQRRQTIVDATAQLMQEGVDYGKIPGTSKNTLLAPGADKLCNLFGLIVCFEISKQIEDWHGESFGEPLFHYQVKCKLYRGDPTNGGVLMGEGDGSCNSWESKYRWRNSERVCPNCGKPNIRKSKNDDGGWYCWAKLGGCGKTFAEEDTRITSQNVGRVANPDVYDLTNTILKMANKRAKVAAVLNATSAHEFFTQDVEDLEDLPPSEPLRPAREPEVTEPVRQAAKPPQPKAAAAPPPAPAWPEEDSPLVRTLWGRMDTPRKALDALLQLERDVEASCGSTVPFWDILTRHKMGTGDLQQDMKKAGGNTVRQAAKEVLELLERLRQQNTPPTVVDAEVVDDRESWVPEIIGSPKS